MDYENSIVFYSLYGHVFKMAKAVSEGVAAVEGTQPVLRKFIETLDASSIKTMGADVARKEWQDVPEVKISGLEECDAMLIGSPTRFGGATGQVRQFLDATGGLWAKQTM